jgi:FK506-binding nuclear protein
VSGGYTVYLTGNFVVPEGEPSDIYDSDEEEDEEDEEDYLSDELLDDEEDELDTLEMPRIAEVDTDDEEVPKLVQSKAGKKGKNKRAAEDLDDEPASLDDMMAKNSKPSSAVNGEPKLSKKQLKKQKNNAGEAVAAAATTKEEPGKDKKSVQFAKNLEQGPTGKAKDKAKDMKKEVKSESNAKDKSKSNADDKSKSKSNADDKSKSKSSSEDKSKSNSEDKTKSNSEDKSKPALGVKVVNGVKIDDKKLGKGPGAKKGDRVAMRYIGKLTDGKVFDCKL